MDAKAGQGYAKHAWLIIFVYALLSVIASPINLLGAPPNPPSPERETGLSLDQMDARMPGLRGYISAISRQLGNFLLGMAVLLMGIAAVPYRKGERWAWLVCWILPVNLVIQIANSLSAGGFLWQVDLAFLLVVLAGLLLPFRRFFPKGG